MIKNNDKSYYIRTGKPETLKVSESQLIDKKEQLKEYQSD